MSPTEHKQWRRAAEPGILFRRGDAGQTKAIQTLCDRFGPERADEQCAKVSVYDEEIRLADKTQLKILFEVAHEVNVLKGGGAPAETRVARFEKSLLSVAQLLMVCKYPPRTFPSRMLLPCLSCKKYRGICSGTSESHTELDRL